MRVSYLKKIIRMGPLLYSLCHKSAIGLALYVVSACAFPPLLRDSALPLQQANARLVAQFEAPVSKPYALILNFDFPSAASVRQDEVVGSNYSASCQSEYAAIPDAHRASLGRPIPIHVRIREKETGTVALDRVVNTLCMTSSGPNGAGYRKTRTAARIALAAGNYLAEITNMEAQKGLDGVRTSVALVSGDVK